ncbi:MAG TPA: DUF357 domain-containing protein [Hadesarchaea archaeon]|nr:DUF357 domain-containing protein [Hadesarchaea archaeon]
MVLEKDLLSEIQKWSKKLNEAMSDVKPVTPDGMKLFANIKAYYDDSAHFLDNRELIKSFESLIWAWALLEIGKELKHIR